LVPESLALPSTNDTRPALDPTTWATINSIEGWLSFSAAEFSWNVIQHQARSGHSTDVLELGVFRGKFLAALYRATQGLGSRVVGIDGFFERVSVPLKEEWYGPARQTMIDNVILVSGEAERLTLIRADTMHIDPDELAQDLGTKFGFISVDAGHEAENVVNDLCLVRPLLEPHGVIAADDAFNAVVPGVPEGIISYFRDHNDGQLAPFAYCGNKLYICRTDQHSSWLAFAKNLANSGASDYQKNTGAHSRTNTDVGFVPHFCGYEILPFLG
jgi:hypothetical protein